MFKAIDIGLRKGLTQLIRMYRAVSGAWRPPCCRFFPSCSHYALQALQTYPAHKATGLIIWRILRCHPFCRGGYDPIK